jgi:hypothetical protein
MLPSSDFTCILSGMHSAIALSVIDLMGFNKSKHSLNLPLLIPMWTKSSSPALGSWILLSASETSDIFWS